MRPRLGSNQKRLQKQKKTAATLIQSIDASFRQDSRADGCTTPTDCVHAQVVTSTSCEKQQLGINSEKNAASGSTATCRTLASASSTEQSAASRAAKAIRIHLKRMFDNRTHTHTQKMGVPKHACESITWCELRDVMVIVYAIGTII